MWFRMLLAALFLLPVFAEAGQAEDRGVVVDPGRVAPMRGALRLALCIGIDGYDAKSGYQPLKFAGADARLLSGALARHGYETTVMTDAAKDPALRPTYRNIDEQLWQFTKRATSPQDTLIVSFAGHGDVQGKQTVLLPLDYTTGGRTLTLSHPATTRKTPQGRSEPFAACRCLRASLALRGY